VAGALADALRIDLLVITWAQLPGVEQEELHDETYSLYLECGPALLLVPRSSSEPETLAAALDIPSETEGARVWGSPT
jgi:hypothetical protein